MLASIALAWSHPCTDTTLEQVVDVPMPAVVLLGERHGSRPDMKHAEQVVRALSKRGPVTLAMEAVHEQNQPVLDRFAQGEIKPGRLRKELDWGKTWGFDWAPYKRLVMGSRKGHTVVAAGLDLGPKPEGREVPIHEDYDAYLKEMMGPHSHGMKPEIAARFTTSMAWRDFRIAELAEEGWSGDGFLVVLTGRGHVEGSMGSNWQLEQMVSAPVSSVVLGHEGARCNKGDRVLAD